MKVKSLEDVEKNFKVIDIWIESIFELYRFKFFVIVYYIRYKILYFLL